jgi:EAL domain-containing protein (putative c-di-GMP-specific phosphodiesterase class I)
MLDGEHINELGAAWCIAFLPMPHDYRRKYNPAERVPPPAGDDFSNGRGDRIMPTDESSSPALTDRGGAPRRSARAPQDSDQNRPTMRSQAQQIIELVLADPAPQGKEARERLRDSVAAHPGNPERALLEHLMVTGALANAPAVRTEPLPEDDLQDDLRGDPSTDEPYPARLLVTGRGSRRIQEILGDRLLLTAFQPIHDLSTLSVIGVEALTRFVSDDGVSADYWFKEAAAAGLGAELEFAALQTALVAAEELPRHLYVALNLSPTNCLDPRLPGILHQSPLSLDRIVLELTEHAEVEDYAPLIQALAPLRFRGLRVAADNTGSGLFSLRHVMHLRPEIIKLDRSLVAGIDTAASQRFFGRSMVDLAKQVGADLVAEGVETRAELNAVTALGMAAGQGYFLGRPSVRPPEWARWRSPAEQATTAAGPTRPGS